MKVVTLTSLSMKIFIKGIYLTKFIWVFTCGNLHSVQDITNNMCEERSDSDLDMDSDRQCINKVALINFNSSVSTVMDPSVLMMIQKIVMLRKLWTHQSAQIQEVEALRHHPQVSRIYLIGQSYNVQQVCRVVLLLPLKTYYPQPGESVEKTTVIAFTVLPTSFVDVAWQLKGDVRMDTGSTGSHHHLEC